MPSTPSKSTSIHAQNSDEASWPSPMKIKTQQTPTNEDPNLSGTNGNGNGNGDALISVSKSASRSSPPVTAKSARNFWQQKLSQPRNTTSWKKQNNHTDASTRPSPSSNIDETSNSNDGHGSEHGPLSPSPPQSNVSGSSVSGYSQSSKTLQAMTQRIGARMNNNNINVYSNANGNTSGRVSSKMSPALVEEDHEFTGDNDEDGVANGSNRNNSGARGGQHSYRQNINQSQNHRRQDTNDHHQQGNHVNSNPSPSQNILYSLKKVTHTRGMMYDNMKKTETPPSTSIQRKERERDEETSLSFHSEQLQRHEEETLPSPPPSTTNSNQHLSPLMNVKRKTPARSQNYQPQHSMSTPSSKPQQARAQDRVKPGQQSQQIQQYQPSTDDGTLGEMQIKLDIALAKVLTEEMKHADVKSQLQGIQQSSQSRLASLQSKIKTFQDREGEWVEERKEQKEEMQELYMEIERLHESHKAERGLKVGEQGEMKKEIQMVRDELEDMKRQRDQIESEMNQMVHAHSHRANEEGDIRALKETVAKKEEELKQTKEELKEVKKDVNGITKDFKELVDETERLEIELEAVTEDRDELLRRSVVYNNHGQENPNSTSTLSETSKQHEAEIDRMRTLLLEQEEIGKEKDLKIQEFEKILEKSKGPFDLDLSAIDVENNSYVVEWEGVKKEYEGRLRDMQGEYNSLQDTLESIRQDLSTTQEERDQLKNCLADAMQELEQNEMARAGENDAFAEELMQIVKEKDSEIEVLVDQLTAEMDLRNSQQPSNRSGESFQEELNNVVEWLDSSTRINGSPSIEMMMLGKTNANVNVKLTPEDDAIVKALERRMNSTHMKLLMSEANLEVAKKLLKVDNDPSDSYDSDVYETSTEASFERGRVDNESKRDMELVSRRKSNDFVKPLREHLKETRDSIQKLEKTNTDLRKSLSEAADLIKPLKEHVSRIEFERVNIQSELAISTKRILQLEKIAKGSTVTENERLSLQKELASSTKRIMQLESEIVASRSPSDSTPNAFDQNNGQFVQVSAFDLRKKDDEIVQLHVAVNQLKGELKEAKSYVNPASISTKGSFDEMPTPTKSNRGKDRSSSTGLTQAANEEDDTKSRKISSELNRLTRELKKKTSAEETLKLIIRDSSSRLNLITRQAEHLANEKNDAENTIKRLENENNQLREELDSSETNNRSTGTNQDHSKAWKDVNDRNDRLSVEASEASAKVKAKSKELKKLKKSLNEAVGMLNALRSHVENSEKERKKLKRHLKALYGKQDISFNSDGTNAAATPELPKSAGKKFQAAPPPGLAHVPDPDKMENETTIQLLRSHIVEMEHEIRKLEERIDEFELSVSTPRSTGTRKSISTDPGPGQAGGQESKHIRKLKEDLAEAESAYDATKTMLDQVSEINKEMLSDLKETEDEAAETVHELEVLQRKYVQVRKEIMDSKRIATFTLKKLEGSERQDSEDVPLTDCINRLKIRVIDLMESHTTPGVSSQNRW